MSPLDPATTESAWRVFLVFLRLGLTSFGGPIAHLSYFRHEFVERRRWLTDRWPCANYFRARPAARLEWRLACVEPAGLVWWPPGQALPCPRPC